MSAKKAVRSYIQTKNLDKSHSLKDCSVVIDGDSFFKDSYKNSDCQFVLGPDCDKYVSYLRNKLKCFCDCKVNCYVIFKGTKRIDLERRQKIQQSIIDERRLIENSLECPSYFEPLLVRDMQKQLLKLLGIKYFCCQRESMDAIIGVARAFKCPVVTDKVEYCLYGVSCIQPNSITYDINNKEVRCNIYDQEIYKLNIGVYNKMPILLTVLSMTSELPECGSIDDISTIIRWVKRHQKYVIDDIANKIDDVDKRKVFVSTFIRNKILYSYSSCNLAVKYFQREKLYGLFKDDKKWFSKGVSCGRIALPYVDMKQEGLVIGSTVINDMLEHDAIQAAAPIISYAHCFLTNCQSSNLKYIGRKKTVCTTWDFEKNFKHEICNRDIFTKHGKMKRKPSVGNSFELFIKEILSEYVADHMHSVSICDSSRILVLTLVYYVQRVNKNFIDGAYFILLCYLILGPIRQHMENASIDDMDKDCRHMHEKLKFLFEYNCVILKYHTCILHSLAEFLHCLQHMNYLNNLCGNNHCDFPPTLYYKTYNATFVYNCYILFKNKNKLILYLKNNFKDSKALQLYKNLVSQFEDYLKHT